MSTVPTESIDRLSDTTRAVMPEARIAVYRRAQPQDRVLPAHSRRQASIARS